MLLKGTFCFHPRSADATRTSCSPELSRRYSRELAALLFLRCSAQRRPARHEMFVLRCLKKKVEKQFNSVHFFSG